MNICTYTSWNMSWANVTQKGMAKVSLIKYPKFLFCHETLHVSGIYCAHHQELSTVHVAIGIFHAGYVAAA